MKKGPLFHRIQPARGIIWTLIRRFQTKYILKVILERTFRQQFQPRGRQNQIRIIQRIKRSGKRSDFPLEFGQPVSFPSFPGVQTSIQYWINLADRLLAVP